MKTFLKRFSSHYMYGRYQFPQQHNVNKEEDLRKTSVVTSKLNWEVVCF